MSKSKCRCINVPEGFKNVQELYQKLEEQRENRKDIIADTLSFHNRTSTFKPVPLIFTLLFPKQ